MRIWIDRLLLIKIDFQDVNGFLDIPIRARNFSFVLSLKLNPLPRYLEFCTFLINSPSKACSTMSLTASITLSSTWRSSKLSSSNAVSSAYLYYRFSPPICSPSCLFSEASLKISSSYKIKLEVVWRHRCPVNRYIL